MEVAGRRTSKNRPILRIIASSIQLIPTEHCWEKWANFPKERIRMFELLRTTDASGVIVISGDRHLGEISVLPLDYLGYPLYEITSSGLNSALGENSDARDEQNSFSYQRGKYSGG